VSREGCESRPVFSVGYKHVASLDTAIASPFKRRKSKPKSKSKSLSQAEAERRQRQREQQLQHRDRVLSFLQWCAINGFSEATGRRILKSGNGPPVLQLSPRRIGIRESDNAAWQASRAR
jgi:predicted DNA-binding transcriptional regulator AlpA